MIDKTGLEYLRAGADIWANSIKPSGRHHAGTPQKSVKAQ